MGTDPPTCRATTLFFTTSPRLPISNFVPTPCCPSVSVAVVTTTLSHNAQREERASPRKPNEVRVVKEEKEVNFEVWWFRAEGKRFQMKRGDVSTCTTHRYCHNPPLQSHSHCQP